MKGVEAESDIRHLAFIMDGNRRWAKKRGKTPSDGHEEGFRNMERILSPLFQRGIPWISVYAFSSENWNRPQKEIDVLHDLIRRFKKRNIEEYKERGIRVCVSGSERNLSQEMKDLIHSLQEETKNLTNGTLNLCFNYGGREEIVRATQNFSRDVQSGKIQLEDLNEEKFRQYLFVPNIPDVDLMIRTSGEQRISNFLLYQLSYAELYFTPTLWPDLTIEEVDSIFQIFSHRERRFGR